MKRRNFLQTLLGLAGTTVLPVNSNIHGQQQNEPSKLLKPASPGLSTMKVNACSINSATSTYYNYAVHHKINMINVR